MRKAFTALAVLLLLVVVAQFFLAAAGGFQTAPRDESYQPHRVLGYGIVLLAILLTGFAAVARLPGRLIGAAGLVAVLALLQMVIRGIAGAFGDTAGPLVFGLHAVNALVIAAVTVRIVRQARELSTPARP